MNTLPEVPAPAVSHAEYGFAMSIVAIACGLGIVISICLASYGLDVGATFF